MRRRSYAIWWNEGSGPRHAGKLQLGLLHVLLSGNKGGRVALPLEELTAVSYTAGELTLRRSGGAPIRIGSLDAPGALLELTDVLARVALTT
jgi:hypothetical protein